MLKQVLQTGKSIVSKNKVSTKTIQNTIKCSFGNNDQRTPQTQTFQSLYDNNWHYNTQDAELSEWTHKSNAEQYIAKIPIIEVDQPIVRCTGGTEINAGHPQVYIQLNTRNPGEVQACKYCGLRYVYKKQH